MSPVRPAAVICLAAGEGTRMRSALPKVLHTIGGRTLLGHAVAAARALDPVHLVVVVRHGRDRVVEHVRAIDPTALLADQDEVAGTGRAVECGLQELPAELTGTVVVTYADVPLLRAATLQDLVEAHHGRAVTVLTATLPDPRGYGRIVRDPEGQVAGIVEQRDADDEQAAITEINSGIFAFDVEVLRAALAQVGAGNAQGEKYLTDVVAIARRDGHPVGAHLIEDLWQSQGVNDRVQLAGLGAELNRRTLVHWMQAGVTVVDPATTWVDVGVRLAPDVTLLPGTQLHGATVVASGAHIGPDTTLTDVEVDAGASVVRTHGSGARIGAGASVGPFAYLRPGTVLGEAGKVGTFVETKNAEIGPGAKVPHLSYLGDASIGEGSNIGAGTITANYDGVTKSRTTIGRHCRTGSDNVFVAPVQIGDGAFTGAGTVVRRDVAPGSLAVSGGSQRQVDDWVARKRSGSAADRAAAQARTGQGAQSSEPAAPNEEPHA